LFVILVMGLLLDFLLGVLSRLITRMRISRWSSDELLGW